MGSLSIEAMAIGEGDRRSVHTIARTDDAHSVVLDLVRRLCHQVEVLVVDARLLCHCRHIRHAGLVTRGRLSSMPVCIETREVSDIP